MKKVPFKIAKTIKEAGYPQGNTPFVYASKSYYDRNIEKNLQEGQLIEEGILFFVDATTYLEVWLWLWREKKVDKQHLFILDPNEDPEEAIITAIDYLVDNDLI